jgi:hypothetical protein
MFQVIFTLIAVVGASVHLAFSSERRSSGAAIAGTYLLSASIGWSTSPYEYEVGMADLTVKKPSWFGSTRGTAFINRA